jgi:NADH-quinone oxidoreductase subunit L
MWVGSLALAGVPFFAGYYSKDVILESAFAAHTGFGEYAFWLGIAAAALTAFYSWRLLFLTFHGAPRADEHTMAHVHESPLVMTIPLGVLALGAVVTGFLGYDHFVGEKLKAFWGESILVLPVHHALEGAHHVPTWVALLPIVVAVAGLAAAYVCYIHRTEIPGLIAEAVRPLYRFLLNKWYFDELYDWLFVRPAHAIGRGLWKGGDGALIDGLGPDGIASLARTIAQRASALQTGYVYHYAFAMLMGVVALVTWYLSTRAG